MEESEEEEDDDDVYGIEQSRACFRWLVWTDLTDSVVDDRSTLYRQKTKFVRSVRTVRTDKIVIAPW